MPVLRPTVVLPTPNQFLVFFSWLCYPLLSSSLSLSRRDRVRRVPPHDAAPGQQARDRGCGPGAFRLVEPFLFCFEWARIFLNGPEEDGPSSCRGTDTTTRAHPGPGGASVRRSIRRRAGCFGSVSTRAHQARARRLRGRAAPSPRRLSAPSPCAVCAVSPRRPRRLSTRRLRQVSGVALLTRRVGVPAGQADLESLVMTCHIRILSLNNRE